MVEPLKLYKKQSSQIYLAHGHVTHLNTNIKIITVTKYFNLEKHFQFWWLHE